MYKIPLVEIIKRAENVHGKGRYDYSAITEENYKGQYQYCTIKCNKCGKVFEQKMKCHLKGEGCSRCSGNETSNTEDFIQKAEKIYGKGTYDYSEVNYINSYTKVTIICPKHGRFYMKPNTHLCGGLGCSKCNQERILKESQENFIKRAKEMHGETTYDYSRVHYLKATEEVELICNKCHKHFFQTPLNHLNGSGCTECHKSKGERLISEILDSKHIKYTSQYRFKDCKDKISLPFDFYLPEYNSCIEYDGRQHFLDIDYFGGKKNLIYIQKHDKIKTDYCKKNNIELLRIKYTENVEDKLSQFLSDKFKIEPQSIFDL